LSDGRVPETIALAELDFQLQFRIIRQSGHIVMSNGETRLIIPRANPVDPYTRGDIARDAGMTPDEFRRLL
jgi:hypothetical protein